MLSGKGPELPSAFLRRHPKCSFTYRLCTALDSRPVYTLPTGEQTLCAFWAGLLILLGADLFNKCNDVYLPSLLVPLSTA